MATADEQHVRRALESEIARLHGELDAQRRAIRAEVAEEIAKDLESDGQFEFKIDGDYAARIAREHGKEK